MTSCALVYSVCILVHMNEAAAKKLTRAKLDEHTEGIARELITNWEERYGDIDPESVTGLAYVAEGDHDWIDSTLATAARSVAAAEATTATARAELTEAIRLADAANMPETQIARKVGAARLTVRRALGK